MTHRINSFNSQISSVSTNKLDFDSLWSLMDQCFQSDYMRTYEGQKSLLQTENYNVNVIKDNDTLIAFMAWWDFSWCNFIEYIGVCPEYRCQGLARTLLTSILQNNKLTILEIDDKNKNAYTLYKKEGFYINSFDYSPIALKPGGCYYQKLKLMSFPRKLTEDEYKRFITELHKPVYNQYREV